MPSLGRVLIRQSTGALRKFVVGQSGTGRSANGLTFFAEPTASNSSTSDCSDKDSDQYCLAWKGRGYCDGGSYRPFLMAHCRKTCGVCRCSDTSQYCLARKGHGYCDGGQYRPFMRAKCSKTCGVCQRSAMAFDLLRANRSDVPTIEMPLADALAERSPNPLYTRCPPSINSSSNALPKL